MDDLFYEYIDLYEQREVLKALQLVLQTPSIKYEDLKSSFDAFQQIINFTDACAFKTFQEAHVAASALLQVLENNPLTQTFKEQVNWEKHFLEMYVLFDPEEESDQLSETSWIAKKLLNLKQSTTISNDQIEEAVENFPEEFHPFIRNILKTLQNWKRLIQSKPLLKTLLEAEFPIYTQQPWHFSTYPIKPKSKPALKNDSIPLIFIELFEDENYEELLSLYLAKEAVLVFENPTVFLQFLSIPSDISILLKKHVFVYILSLYPQEQIVRQNLQKLDVIEFQTIILSENSYFHKNSSLFSELFLKCLKQDKEAFKQDSNIANKLYELSKKILFETLSERYGEKRHIALRMQSHYEKWFGEHKGQAENDFSYDSTDYFSEKLHFLANQRHPRNISTKQKIKLAHIVPQIMDGGHAPSTILNNLLNLADRDQFELFVFSTERLVTHTLEYPVATYSSLPSFETGVHFIENQQSRNVKIDIEKNPIMYEKTAENIAQKLQNNQIDIAIFHGSDEINTLISVLSDLPLRVFFEHGTAPSYPEYDVTIFSAEETMKLFEKKFPEIKVKNYFLNFCIDPKNTWNSLPYSRESIGLPVDGFMMTTISNHLEARLSPEMCKAICEILKQAPQAYYAPIGQIKNPAAFLNRFGIYQNRILVVGQKSNPSQFARSMDLYLNEFPFGSCLGILDAMASGCPVVSMFDENGPPQSRYGGTFFGLDHVVTSCDPKEYIALACRLANDPFFYKEWSDHALQEFDKRVDVAQYVKKLEKILLSNFRSKIKK